jgi:hypothetical protein
MTDSIHPKLNDMARSMYGSFCPQTADDEYDEGPFSRARDYYGEERLISAGTHSELEQFAVECLLSSTVTIELDVPQLNVFLPGHMFLEVKYYITIIYVNFRSSTTDLQTILPYGLYELPFSLKTLKHQTFNLL